ncbi:hypothetical protein Tco_1206999 [Tanacetum coccineum]
MSLANQKETTEYQEAIQATEDLESPAVGFAKTSDYKGGLHALHRRSAGTNALVVLRDTRWEDSRQIIRTIEVDLSAGTQLVYMFPNMVLSVDHFHIHVEVAIQTNGYDTCMDNVVDHLTTTGITTIPSERRSVVELEGMSWNLKPSEQTLVRVPSRESINEMLNKSLSLQFERYRRSPQPTRHSVDQHDREILDFLDEYLPQWYDQLATQKQRLESEWENPFATKRGEDHTILHLYKDDDDDNLLYPKFQNFKQMATKIISKHKEQAFPTSIEYKGSYQPPPDAVMGPSVYPPPRKDPQQFYKLDY